MFACKQCGKDIGWDAPSGVCSTECLKAAQGFAAAAPLPKADALRLSGFDTPNLDDMSIDPADFDEAADVFKTLAQYAECKAAAMRYRRLGCVPDKLESQCERLYRKLPEWARW